jgi:hypothetical protein
VVSGEEQTPQDFCPMKVITLREVSARLFGTQEDGIQPESMTQDDTRSARMSMDGTWRHLWGCDSDEHLQWIGKQLGSYAHFRKELARDTG